ncbi:MAG: isopenicillin N synthase family oxygenase [Methylotenera sp.]|nr:isopenicillin N synthase family oxygenase [Oligoflexia bacterium]
MKVKTVDFKSPTAGREFTESLRQTGFAVISNHPIAHQLILDSFKEWGEFFSSEEKHKYTFEPTKQAGYFPFRTENAKDSKKKDLKEFYHYYPWGELPPTASDKTPRLYKELLTMGSTLLNWIEENTPAEIRKKFSMPLGEMIGGSGDTLLRPIHYPPLTGVEEEGAVRAAAHEDINLITLLPSATAPGLQVKDTSGTWHEVECDPGTIVVNSGDMLKLASDHYYPSTTHQVINPSGPLGKVSRYSMPLFLHPKKDVKLSSTHTAATYLAERLREIGLLPKN